MRTLVVGGTGMIGHTIARDLRDRGDEVVLCARREPAASDFPVITGDYTDPAFDPALLRGFEGLVFAAGNDVRHLGRDGVEDRATFWRRTQSEGIPRFLALARDAGVARVVGVGSYYHQVRPDLRAASDYIEARALADERSRALSTSGFEVITVNPPSVLGTAPGRVDRWFGKLGRWGLSTDPSEPDFAPPGGSNYMAVASVAEAVCGALVRGVGGTAYLIGDANLTYRELFLAAFRAVGSDRDLVERDQEHPYFPDEAIVHGRGVVIAYDADPEERALLGYATGQARDAITALTREAQ